MSSSFGYTLPIGPLLRLPAFFYSSGRVAVNFSEGIGNIGRWGEVGVKGKD